MIDKTGARRAEPISAPNVELGCGHLKRDGFFGIDVQGGPGVDLILDIETQALPFADDSVERIYSSHTFEHLCAPGSPVQTFGRGFPPSRVLEPPISHHPA